MTEPIFEPFEKIARLSRNCWITEKIDGTNGQIYIGEAGEFAVGSRNGWITPERDNFNFARWAFANKDELLKLGPGRHFGEWWGSGIQRGYGLVNGEKRFSLFNVGRWTAPDAVLPACVSVVPVLYSGMFEELHVRAALADLASFGSRASPGFMKPEGVVVYHAASRSFFKKTIEKDSEPKGKAA